MTKAKDTPITMERSRTLHPDAKNAYNCHSYAFHNKNGDPTDPRNAPFVDLGVTKWDQSPSDDLGDFRQLDANEANRTNDIVLYYDDANGNGKYDDGEMVPHSAVVAKVDMEGNTLLVKAKIGEFGVSEHHPAAPGYYESATEVVLGEDGSQTQTKRKFTASRAYFRKEVSSKPAE